ncbi:MAG: ferredoxin [Pseudonocardiaceae bacterium]
MADITIRLAENTPGPFFVDAECIDCDTCRCIASDFFERNDEKGYSYVSRQPENEDDEEIVFQAMDCCPQDAIGHVE